MGVQIRQWHVWFEGFENHTKTTNSTIGNEPQPSGRGWVDGCILDTTESAITVHLLLLMGPKCHVFKRSLKAHKLFLLPRIPFPDANLMLTFSFSLVIFWSILFSFSLSSLWLSVVFCFYSLPLILGLIVFMFTFSTLNL